MVVRTSEDCNHIGDRIIFDTGHGLAAARTDRVRNGNGFSLRQNGVDIFGGFDGDKVGQIRGEKMATTIKTFVDVLGLTIGGFDGDE